MSHVLYLDDCLDRLPTIPDNYVDSIVTDPPYEISFMGKGWDGSGIAYDTEMWKEVLRVLKPGGHLLSFGATRTHHRMMAAIEDAGFEIRDCLMWLYGSGFPKGSNISKGIDKKFGAEREVIGMRKSPYTSTSRNDSESIGKHDVMVGDDGYELHPITAPATAESAQWDGWGTTLKPAWEPIVMARKPLAEKTIIDNVLKYGTGGINIDDCRIATDGEQPKGSGNAQKGTVAHGDRKALEGGSITPSEGRWPANLILDEEAGQMLDEQSGIVKGGHGGLNSHGFNKTGQGIYGKGKGCNSDGSPLTGGYTDTGGASRFFYCPKASKAEKSAGLGGPNTHPTIKPLDLMEYLVKLVTPKGGTVLDPFMGSGSTGCASVRQGFDFIGIELEEESFEIAEQRIKHWEK